MFRNPHFDRLRQTFADQFAGDSHGFIYRKGQTGAPIRVSEIERDEFIAAFDKRIRYAMWSTIPTTAALILLLAWLIPDTDSPAADKAIWVGIGVILLPLMALFYRAWNAPARVLERRTPEGAALSKEQARALALSKITYGQLAIAAVVGAGLVWKMSAETDVFHGWGVVWLIFGGGLVALAGVQAIRKWRFSSSHSVEQA